MNIVAIIINSYVYGHFTYIIIAFILVEHVLTKHVKTTFLLWYKILIFLPSPCYFSHWITLHNYLSYLKSYWIPVKVKNCIYKWPYIFKFFCNNHSLDYFRVFKVCPELHCRYIGSFSHYMYAWTCEKMELPNSNLFG